MHAAERCLDAERTDATVLVTGASDGIGRETALALGRRGATVLVHGRDPEKTAAVVDAVDDTDGAALGPYLADFTDLDAVRDLAADVSADADLDVLVNNAGTHFSTGAVTTEGVERTVAVNVLAPFVLTARLFPEVAAGRDPADGSPGGRIVVVASEAHRGTEFDLDGFRRVNDYESFEAYRRSKLGDVLFTRELARRAEAAAEARQASESERDDAADDGADDDIGVTVNASHPGFVPDSALWRDVSLPVRVGIGIARRLPERFRPGLVNSEAEGAAPSVLLAIGGAAADWSGEYVGDCSPMEPDDPARDADAARRLWEWCSEVAGEEFDFDAAGDE